MTTEEIIDYCRAAQIPGVEFSHRRDLRGNVGVHAYAPAKDTETTLWLSFTPPKIWKRAAAVWLGAIREDMLA